MDNKKITIDDVAKALNVSKTTVSRAISGKGRVGKETRDRVMEYITEHNYVPSAMAKGLAQSRTYNIALTVPDDFALVDLPFFQKCLMGVCDYAGAENYDVVVTMTSADNISQLERLVTNRKVDGVILSRTFAKDLPMEFMLESGVPFVTLGSTKQPGVIQIDSDHEAACWELTTNLLKSGYQSPALLCGDRTHIVTKSRLQGFMNAMHDAGFGDTEPNVYSELTDENLPKIVERMIQSKVDCILCMDDTICVKTLDILRNLKKEVPKDIAIASFYNSSILERNVPSITSLQFDAKELGRTACKTLLMMISGESVPARLLLGYEIAFNDSTKR